CQRQDDVGFEILFAVMGEESADQWQIAQPDDAREHTSFIVADQTREQVGLAVVQSNHRADIAVAEGWQSTESCAGNTAHFELQRERYLVVMVRARRDVDVDADVLVVERRDRLLADATRCNWREGG